MEELEKVFKQIRKENIDFDTNVGNGDIYIPLELSRKKDLTANEKIYLATYYCFKKNINKADKYMQLNKTQLWKIKKKLFELGFLKVKEKNIETLKEETIKKSHKGNKCEWCGKECYILQEHHYPIPAKNGGKEIVKICPNCHYTFHKLENENYE